MTTHKHWKGIVLFLLPVSIMYFAFFIYPLGYVFTVSLSNYRGFGDMEFVGLANFTRLFEMRNFRFALRNNLIWVFALGFGQVAVAAIVAMILARKPPFWRFLRTAYFLPNVISQVAIAMLWYTIYRENFGLINTALRRIGLDHLALNWLGNLDTALPAVIGQQFFYIGYFMIIMLAGIMSIPRSLYESAEMDGANVFQQEFFITIPMVKDIGVVAMTLAMAFGIRHFEATYLLTGGGPANRTMT
ncbi:MAG: carbohydrate ABC transporter permease, partial [Spirochaetales bacterium]